MAPKSGRVAVFGSGQACASTDALVLRSRNVCQTPFISLRFGSLKVPFATFVIPIPDFEIVLALMGRSKKSRMSRQGANAGSKLHDGPRNVLLQAGVCMHAEILRVIQIRAAVAGHELPKREIGDVLHRREREHRRWGSQELLEWRGR